MPLYHDGVSPYLAIPENFDGDFLSLITYLKNNDIIEIEEKYFTELSDLADIYNTIKGEIEEKIRKFDSNLPKQMQAIQTNIAELMELQVAIKENNSSERLNALFEKYSLNIEESSLSENIRKQIQSLDEEFHRSRTKNIQSLIKDEKRGLDGAQEGIFKLIKEQIKIKEGSLPIHFLGNVHDLDSIILQVIEELRAKGLVVKTLSSGDSDDFEHGLITADNKIIEIKFDNELSLLMELEQNGVITIKEKGLLFQYFSSESKKEREEIIEFLRGQAEQKQPNIIINFDIFSHLIRFVGESNAASDYFKLLLSANEQYYYYNISKSANCEVKKNYKSIKTLNIAITQRNSENALDALILFLNEFFKAYDLSFKAIPKEVIDMLPEALVEGGEYTEKDKTQLQAAFNTLFKDVKFNDLKIHLQGTINTRNQPLRLCFEFMSGLQEDGSFKNGALFNIEDLAQYADNLDLSLSKKISFDEQSTPEEFLKQLRNNQIIDIGNYYAVLELIKDKKDAIDWKVIGNVLKIREGLQINFTGNLFASSQDKKLLDLLLSVKEKLEKDGKSSVEMSDFTVDVYSTDEERNRKELLSNDKLTLALIAELETAKIPYYRPLYSHTKIHIPSQSSPKESYNTFIDALINEGILYRDAENLRMNTYKGEKPKIYLSGDINLKSPEIKNLIKQLKKHGHEIDTSAFKKHRLSIPSTIEIGNKKFECAKDNVSIALLYTLEQQGIIEMSQAFHYPLFEHGAKNINISKLIDDKHLVINSYSALSLTQNIDLGDPVTAEILKKLKEFNPDSPINIFLTATTEKNLLNRVKGWVLNPELDIRPNAMRVKEVLVGTASDNNGILSQVNCQLFSYKIYVDKNSVRRLTVYTGERPVHFDALQAFTVKYPLIYNNDLRDELLEIFEKRRKKAITIDEVAKIIDIINSSLEKYITLNPTRYFDLIQQEFLSYQSLTENKGYFSANAKVKDYVEKCPLLCMLGAIDGVAIPNPKPGANNNGWHSSVECQTITEIAETNAKKRVHFASKETVNSDRSKESSASKPSSKSSLKLAMDDSASETAEKPNADTHSKSTDISQNFINNWATAYSKTQLKPDAYEHKKDGASVVVYRSKTITTTKQDEAVLEVQKNQIQQVMREDLPRDEREAIEKDLPELIAASLASMGIRLEAELKISGGTPDLQMRVAQLLSQNPPAGYGYKNVVNEDGKAFEFSTPSPVIAPQPAPVSPHSPRPIPMANKWYDIPKDEEGDTDEEVMSAAAEEDVESLEGPAEGKPTRMMPASTTFRPASSRSPSPMSDDDHTTVAEESPVRMPMSGR